MHWLPKMHCLMLPETASDGMESGEKEIGKV
jgi:hypothetical protein